MMNISNVTQYISDTAAAIVASNPATSRVGVATDTGQLFVSDGTNWRAQANTGTINRPWSISTGDTISQSPLLHFDATDSASLTNNLGNSAVVNDSVASWTSGENLGTFIEKRAINQPTYTTNATSKNTPGLLFDGVSNMSLDRAKTSIIGLPLTIFTVYTPTRDSRTERLHDPGDSSNTAPGGTYSKAGLNNYTNRVWGDQILNSYGHHLQYNSGSMGLYHLHSNQYFYLQTATYITNTYTTPRHNQSAGTFFDNYNNNFLGKTQIHVCKIIPHKTASASQSHVETTNTHLTWSDNPGATTSDQPDRNTQHIDRGYNLSGLQLGGESSYNTLHEMIIFNHGLTQAEINNTGQHLFNKWCETDQTFLPTLDGFDAI